MESNTVQTNRFKGVWFLVLYLAPAIACLWPLVLGDWYALKQPWEFWSQAPAGAERILGSILVSSTYAPPTSGYPNYVRTQEGRLYERFVKDGDDYWLAQPVPVSPEARQARGQWRPWDQPPTSRPFVPFVLNPPPGRVLNYLKTDRDVGEVFISTYGRTDVYFALLDDGSIWVWEDPVNNVIGSLLRDISFTFGTSTLIVAGVMVRWLNRANGRPWLWRRGFTTALNSTLGIALFTLLCLILALPLAPVIFIVLMSV